MKKEYQAPEGTVILLMAQERLAALDGHPDSGITPLNDDTPTSSTVIGDDRPF